MTLFFYKLRRDYGFAPNPFHGWCTLATCKPQIRRRARVGDWVAALGGMDSGCAGRLVYAMKVEETISFDAYYADPRFFDKRPVLNDSLKQLYGDNIYHRDADGQWVQAHSHHSLAKGALNLRNLRTDTGVDRVLLSQDFVYFGDQAIALPVDMDPALSEQLRNIGRGDQVFRPTDDDKEVQSLLAWFAALRQEGRWGLQGLPYKFQKARPFQETP